MKNNRKFGNAGESLAADYLVKNGYIIIERNYYAQHGELDIIACGGGYLVFAEVKTRMNTESSLRYGRPAIAVGGAKQKALILSAQEYLYSNPTELYTRIDVIEVYITEFFVNGERWYRVDDIISFENAVKSDSRIKYARKDRF